MHECPECSQACDCDGEDVWYDGLYINCEHDCEDQDLPDDFDDDEPFVAVNSALE